MRVIYKTQHLINYLFIHVAIHIIIISCETAVKSVKVVHVCGELTC